MKGIESGTRRRELFENHWGSYYWWVMLAALAIALAVQYPWKYESDIVIDAIFGLWTLAMYLVSLRRPFEARLIHALGVLPILAFYVSLPETIIPAEYRPGLYILLSFFPIYASTAMTGVPGLIASALLAALLGARMIEESALITIAVLFWSLSGLLGLGYYRMVEKLKRFHEDLLTQALTDPLTGLRNRRALEEDFHRLQALARREGKNLIFTLWDVNNLKHVNDLHGHAAGDRVLRKFANALKDAVRQSDALYRIGGDEFAGLHIGLDEPRTLLQRVRERFPWAASGWVDATHLSLEDAYKIADSNLYVDKSGKADELPQLTLEGHAG